MPTIMSTHDDQNGTLFLTLVCDIHHVAHLATMGGAIGTDSMVVALPLFE